MFLNLDIDYFNNCKQLGVYPKFLIFKLSNVLNKDVLSIRKRLLRSTINKRNKDIQRVLKELSQSETFLSKQLSTIDFYILNRSIITSKIDKYTTKNKSSLTRNCNLSTFTCNAIWIIPGKSDLLKARLYFSSNQIKFEILQYLWKNLSFDYQQP